MASNQFLVRRVAFGNFTYVSTATNATNSVVATGNEIPKGAIVISVSFYPGGAVTNGANYKNGTIGLYVGGQIVGANNRILSQAIIQTAVKSMALTNADGVMITSGGQIQIYFASSDSARTGVAFDADVYVEYLYCGDYDTA